MVKSLYALIGANHGFVQNCMCGVVALAILEDIGLIDLMLEFDWWIKMKIDWLLLSLLVSVVLANYENGELSSGEEYVNEVLFRHSAYTVYRLPYGITFHQILPSGDTIQTFLTHTPCPRGVSCSYERTDFWSIQFSIQKLSVQRKVSLAKNQYYQPMDQESVSVRYADQSAYLLTSNQFSGNADGKLIKIRKTDGVPEQTYEDALHPLFGETEIRAKMNYIYTDRKKVEVIDFDLKLIASVNMGAHFDQVFTLNSHKGFLFLVGSQGPDWKITRFNVTDWTFTEKNLPVIPKYRPSKCIVHDATGNIFLTFQNATLNREDYIPQEQLHLYRFDSNMDNLLKRNISAVIIAKFILENVLGTLLGI